jgi:plastocyanin
MSKNLKIGVGVGIVVALMVFAAASFVFAPEAMENDDISMPTGATHTIVLTEAGYTPAEITIAKGDVVEFSTVRGFEHWPASNLHPTHNLYSAFDPLKPVPAEEAWSFQFTKPGVWKFHDHLKSTYTGVVTVTE